MVKLNLGCGSVRPVGWINTDSSINANLQKIPVIGKTLAKFINPIEYSDTNMVYMNLNRKWKFKEGSVDIVYASHLFEHLSLKASNVFLTEAYRCLKPRGIIRIVVPDLYQIAKKYINEYENDTMEDPTEFIMWAINMHKEGQYGNVGLAKGIVLGVQGYPHQHKYMYDSKSLSKRLKDVGFKSILSLKYGISEYIDCIRDVEGTKESYSSVYIEAIK